MKLNQSNLLNKNVLHRNQKKHSSPAEKGNQPLYPSTLLRSSIHFQHLLDRACLVFFSKDFIFVNSFEEENIIINHCFD
jgi:hypothetical protein